MYLDEFQNTESTTVCSSKKSYDFFYIELKEKTVVDEKYSSPLEHYQYMFTVKEGIQFEEDAEFILRVIDLLNDLPRPSPYVKGFKFYFKIDDLDLIAGHEDYFTCLLTMEHVENMIEIINCFEEESVVKFYLELQ